MTVSNRVFFGEYTDSHDVESVPLSHVSLELGHLYMEDFRRGDEYLSKYFEMVAPWVEAAQKSIARRLRNQQRKHQQAQPGRAAKTGTGPKPRISTCFLVDDYFSQLESPEKIIKMISKAADQAGLEIDYLARESACAVANGVELAELLKGYLAPEPLPNSNGGGLEVDQTGWLANGERTPDFHGPRPPADQTGWVSNEKPTPRVGALAAMTDVSWRPPMQSAPNRHAIFIDVQLWDDKQWSCAYLSAVWQCARLGLLRDHGRAVVHPVRLTEPIAEHWADLPPLLQLTETPTPFSAYRTVSILGSRFQEIEAATRIILGQLAVPLPVKLQLRERAIAERLPLPYDVVDRIDYCFIGEDPSDD